jgi:hypothetical protein
MLKIKRRGLRRSGYKKRFFEAILKVDGFHEHLLKMIEALTGLIDSSKYLYFNGKSINIPAHQLRVGEAVDVL